MNAVEHQAVGGRAPSRHHRPTGASLIAIILAVVSFTGVMLLHVVRGDVDPISEVMSGYANGSHGLIMTIVFYAFGVSAVALGFRLSRAIRRKGFLRVTPWLLALGGLCLIAAGVFEVERPLVPDTLEEMIHSNATAVGFVLVVASMFLFSYVFRTDERWWDFRWISTTLAVTAAVAAMASPFMASTTWSGAVQRLLGLTVILWLLLTARHVRTKAFRTV